jgi:hypothetical protein
VRLLSGLACVCAAWAPLGVAAGAEAGPKKAEEEEATWAGDARPTSRRGSKIRVFVLAGQSNMDGRAKARRLPKKYKRPDKRLLMLHRGTWQVLRPLRGYFGPEMSFAHEMAAAWRGEKIGIVKLAVGATSLAQWNPDGKSTDPRRKPLYAQLMALAKTVGRGPGVKFEGVLWMQGEAESRWGGGHARGYFRRFNRFIARLRKDLGNERLPFVFGRVNPVKSKYTWVDTVRAAQEKASRKIPFTAMVDCDSLSKLPDRIHYDARGQVELGKKFAKAYLGLVARTAERGEGDGPQTGKSDCREDAR